MNEFRYSVSLETYLVGVIPKLIHVEVLEILEQFVLFSLSVA